MISDYEDGMTMKEIQKKYNVPYSKLRVVLIEAGLKLRDRTKKGHFVSEEQKLKVSESARKKYLIDNNIYFDDTNFEEIYAKSKDKVCEWCKKTFTPNSIRAKFCSNECNQNCRRSKRKHHTITTEELEYLIFEKGYRIPDLMKELDIAQRTAYYVLEKHGITIPKKK